MTKKIWSYNHKIPSKIGLYAASHLGLRHPQNYRPVRSAAIIKQHKADMVWL